MIQNLSQFNECIYKVLASVPALRAGLIRIKQYMSIITTHSSVLYVYLGVHSSMLQ